MELDDVQGLVRFGYKHLTEASFLLLRVKDAAAARDWLARAPVTSAVSVDPLPQTALHVALTSEGLRALEVAPDLCAELSTEFVAGMASDAARARRLGDVGANAPARWHWGTGAQTPHVAVLLYAAPGLLAALEGEIEAQCAAGFERIERLSTSATQLAEPFGFADGISQPKVDWERERPVGDHDRLDYDNLVCLGEFLLGYPNEYGLYTPRPLLAPQRDPGRLLPRAEDAPEQADVGRNGCYLVLRQLQQDVQLFWQELDRQAGGDADLRERLAAAMVGRKKNGEPLAGADETTRERLRPQRITDRRSAGLRCPLGAHIRRCNPRNADLPPGGRGLLSRLWRMLGFNAAALDLDLVASTRFHRLLRRGRKYGDVAAAVRSAADPRRGRRAVSTSSAWRPTSSASSSSCKARGSLGSKFAGLTGESDPMVGHRLPDAADVPTDGFSIPQAGGPDCAVERPAAVRHRAGRRLLLLARDPRVALPRHGEPKGP